ncbi:MAG: UDP-N-acetylglucosamine 2-epimerase [Thermincola sp.]|jgi:UDP-hydrolysing UDP-N-acetyl-D-glucosamine 2-epimerase|nr:UDP-N-acetylglucosamine 2-epimerase [Thermincola sp.]MDT3703477.1 UDP-N-acetylglucosamine 2-epimerase [Thermincola sp.]
MKRKICVVITARPSYSRIKTALEAILAHPDLELQLVVTASTLLDRYGSAVKQMEKDGFQIAARVYMVFEGENLVTTAKTTGLGIIELATVFDNLKPDVVVTIADRYETMSTAITAAYMNIPLVHIQGGEVTGSIDEKVRHGITKLADLHFVATEKAAERVIKMGENESRVYTTGCPSIDIAARVLENPQLDFDPLHKYGGVGAQIDVSNGYLVVMQHPVTTEYSEAKAQVVETLYAIKEIGRPTFWFWPNVDAGSDGTSKGIRMFREVEKPDNILFIKNMAPDDFLKLLCQSYGIIGNSSVAIRECSFLGVPAVNIGTRQVGRERGKNVIDVSYNRRQIVEAVKQHLSNGHSPVDCLYGDGQAGVRIAELLAQVPLTYEKRLAY